MAHITRNTDISIGICSVGASCCSHFWVSVHVGGSSDILINKQGAMRAPGDIGASTCPHCPTSWSVTGSAAVSLNGRMAHQLGDLHVVACGVGIVVTASPNINNRY